MLPLRPLTNSKALALYQADLSTLVSCKNCDSEIYKLPECSTAAQPACEIINKPESEETTSGKRRESLWGVQLRTQGGAKVGLQLWVLETQFILMLLFINYHIIFYMNNYSFLSSSFHDALGQHGNRLLHQSWRSSRVRQIWLIYQGIISLRTWAVSHRLSQESQVHILLDLQRLLITSPSWRYHKSKCI